MKTVLTIAGSDCSGGAGIQADIKTIAAHGMFAMSAITALTAQNTTGVYGIHDTPPDFTKQQLDCIFTDIVPDAVKIGMVSNSATIVGIVEKLSQYEAKNIVLDPVMVSTSGSTLLSAEAMEALINKLVPAALIITPNMSEAQALAGIPVQNAIDMEKAAAIIARFFSGSILIKGGHLDNCADDLLYQNGKILWLRGKKIHNPNTHGTGCTLSSAIACNLAKGFSIEESVHTAKDYVSGALKSNLNLGRGRGPLNHQFAISGF